MAAGYAPVVFLAGIVHCFLLCQKIIHGNMPAVTMQLAARSHDMCFPAASPVECRHGKRRSGPAFKFQVDNLVIDYIIVAGIDTPAVRAFFQRFHDSFSSMVCCNNADRPVFRIAFGVYLKS